MSKKRTAFLIMASLVLAMIFGGCGGGGGDESSGYDGGGDSNAIIGLFNGPVVGLGYTRLPSNIGGVTDANGYFDFAGYDEGLIFKVGNISLPEIDIDTPITPRNYYPDGDPNQLKLIRLLMSAGQIGVDGTITIPASPLPFDGLTGTFPEVFDELESAGKILYDDAQAQMRHDESLESLIKSYAGNYAGTFEGSLTGDPLTGNWTAALTITAIKDGYGWDGLEKQGELGGTIMINGESVNVDEGTIEMGGDFNMTCSDYYVSGSIHLPTGTIGGAIGVGDVYTMFSGKKQ